MGGSKMKRILSCLFVSALLLTGCSSSSFRSALDSLNPSIPEAINQAVSSRVNAENELYTVGSASIGQTGSIIAQSKAKDRKSTRLNSSHANISYAVFCLKKKKITHITRDY